MPLPPHCRHALGGRGTACPQRPTLDVQQQRGKQEEQLAPQPLREGGVILAVRLAFSQQQPPVAQRMRPRAATWECSRRRRVRTEGLQIGEHFAVAAHGELEANADAVLEQATVRLGGRWGTLKCRAAQEELVRNLAEAVVVEGALPQRSSASAYARFTTVVGDVAHLEWRGCAQCRQPFEQPGRGRHACQSMGEIDGATGTQVREQRWHINLVEVDSVAADAPRLGNSVVLGRPQDGRRRVREHVL